MGHHSLRAMRRAILILGLLLGACGGDDALGGGDGGEVELLPAIDRATECDGGAVLDAEEIYEALSVCASDGAIPMMETSAGTLCWALPYDDAATSEACDAAMDLVSPSAGCPERPADAPEGPNPSVCHQVSADVWCQVGKAVLCEDANAPGCETPEAINERADATVAAICG